MVSWADWLSITFAVMSVVLALVSLAYMIGTGFHLPKLQAWAKDELYQALAGGLLTILIVSFVLTLDATMVAIYGQDPFTIAVNYINSIFTALSVFFGSVVALDAVLNIFQSLALKAMPSQTGFTINPFTGLSPLTAMLTLAMEAILGGMGIMLGQSAFLSFIKTQLSILLPIGLALRAFPFSRPAGGAMMAVFLGFYVFYPFLWVFNSAIYDETILQLTLIGPLRNVGNAGNQILNALGVGSSCNENPMSCSTNTPDFGGNIMLALINSIAYPTILYLFIFVVFLPMFNLIVVLVLVNELAKIFGGEIDLGGLGGLI